MKYSTPNPSNLLILSISGFLGSKLPSPPAITTIGDACLVPLSVVTIKELSSCLSMVIALSPKVNPG